MQLFPEAGPPEREPAPPGFHAERVDPIGPESGERTRRQRQPQPPESPFRTPRHVVSPNLFTAPLL